MLCEIIHRFEKYFSGFLRVVSIERAFDGVLEK